MTTRFSLNVALPANNREEFIEAITGIGGIECITVTVDAENKRDAVRDLTELFEEFAATYQGTHYFGLKEAVQEVTHKQQVREAGAKVLRLARTASVSTPLNP